MPFYINVFWTKHHSSGGLEYWYTDEPLSVVVHDLEKHFRYNRNFQSYRLLQSFQSLSCLSTVWYPTVNRFLIRNSLPSTKRKRMRNARCVATGDPPFFINSSTIKARCSPNHAMVYIENGTYTAVRRRAPHNSTRSPPEAMPLPNLGFLSAAPCTYQIARRYIPEDSSPRSRVLRTVAILYELSLLWRALWNS